LTKEPHIKKWGISIFVKQSIENFKAVLPLIDFLRKPFMRPRHWVELKNHIDFDPES
jgi:dynein heavy chain